MALKINNSGETVDNILQKLKEHYPKLKINKASKRTIIILNGKISSIVRIKKNKIAIIGDINMRNALNLILLVLGILTGIIGVLFIVAILWIIYARKIRKFKTEVYNVLS